MNNNNIRNEVKCVCVCASFFDFRLEKSAVPYLPFDFEESERVNNENNCQVSKFQATSRHFGIDGQQQMCVHVQISNSKNKRDEDEDDKKGQFDKQTKKKFRHKANMKHFCRCAYKIRRCV